VVSPEVNEPMVWPRTARVTAWPTLIWVIPTDAAASSSTFTASIERASPRSLLALVRPSTPRIIARTRSLWVLRSSGSELSTYRTTWLLDWPFAPTATSTSPTSPRSATRSRSRVAVSVPFVPGSRATVIVAWLVSAWLPMNTAVDPPMVVWKVCTSGSSARIASIRVAALSVSVSPVPLGSFWVIWSVS